MKLLSVKLGNSVRVSSRLEKPFLHADKDKVEMTIEDKLFIRFVDLLRPEEDPTYTTIMNMVYCVQAPEGKDSEVKDEPGSSLKRRVVKLKPNTGAV